MPVTERAAIRLGFPAMVVAPLATRKAYLLGKK
jgi:hypothetical protein